jgi:hypothetical protein
MSNISIDEMGMTRLTVYQLDAALKDPKNKPSFRQKAMGAARIFVGAGGTLGGTVLVKDVMRYLYETLKDPDLVRLSSFTQKQAPAQSQSSEYVDEYAYNETDVYSSNENYESNGEYSEGSIGSVRSASVNHATL